MPAAAASSRTYRPTGSGRSGEAADAATTVVEPPCSVSAGLRTWVLGPRPLPEGLTSHTAWVTDLTAGLRVGPAFVELHVDNLFGQQWRDGEFVFPSCFDPAEPCSQLSVRHVTAGTPFAVRALAGIHL